MFFSLKNKSDINIIPDQTSGSIDQSVRRPEKTHASRLKVFAFVISGAILTIFYVSNVMKVNGLLKDVQSRKKQYEKINNYNQILNARINDLQSAERITSIARDRLGMDRGQEAPLVLP